MHSRLGWVVVWVSTVVAVVACSSSERAGDTDDAGHAVDANEDGNASEAGSAGDGAVADGGMPSDSGACPPDMSIHYVKPGCDGDAQPMCLPNEEDACGTWTYCGCDGVSFQGGCGTAKQPYAHVGACGDAQIDAQAD